MSVGYANGIRVMSMTHTGEPGFMLYIPIEVGHPVQWTGLAQYFLMSPERVHIFLCLHPSLSFFVSRFNFSDLITVSLSLHAPSVRPTRVQRGDVCGTEVWHP